jgi:transposase
MANKPFLLPPLSAQDLLELQKLIRSENVSASVFRRCRLIWHLAAGYNMSESAELSGLHYTNAHIWVKRFQQEGLSRLLGMPRPGRPRVYEEDEETVVIQAATSRPTDLGLNFTTWSLIKLENYLRADQGFEELSRETIRRILHRHGLRFLTGQTWCESDDPDFEVKKTPS